MRGAAGGMPRRPRRVREKWVTLLRHTNSSPLIKREKGGRELLMAPFVFVLWYSWS